jgi:hypothetical protein
MMQCGHDQKWLAYRDPISAARPFCVFCEIERLQQELEGRDDEIRTANKGLEWHAKRVQKLESTLRQYADWKNWTRGEVADRWWSGQGNGYDLAREALKEEQK